MAIKILAGIAKDGTNEGARVAAAVALLDRGWGRAPQAVIARTARDRSRW